MNARRPEWDGSSPAMSSEGGVSLRRAVAAPLHELALGPRLQSRRRRRRETALIVVSGGTGPVTVLREA